MHNVIRGALRIVFVNKKEVGSFIIGQIRKLARINPMCIGNNSTGFCLPVNFRKGNNRKTMGPNNILKNISCAHGGKLIGIADQHEMHGRRKGLY